MKGEWGIFIGDLVIDRDQDRSVIDLGDDNIKSIRSGGLTTIGDQNFDRQGSRIANGGGATECLGQRIKSKPSWQG